MLRAFLYVLGSYLNLFFILTMEFNYMLQPHASMGQQDVSPDWYDPPAKDACDTTWEVYPEGSCIRNLRELEDLTVTFTQEYTDEKIPDSPDFIVAMKNQMFYLLNPSIYPEDTEVSVEKSTLANERLIVRLGTVIQPGIIYTKIKFLKPYVWGRLSPQMAVNLLMSESQMTGSRLFMPWVVEAEHGCALCKADVTGIGYSDNFEEGYKTFDMSVGNPHKHGRAYGIGEGGDDMRPTSRLVTSWSLYIVYWSAGIQFLISWVMVRWGWEHQCERHGDIRLSLKSDGQQYRQEWPWYIMLGLALFRMDIVPETMEALKCNKEFFGFTILFVTNTILQVIPFLIVQFYVGCASGMGFGHTFVWLSIVVNLSLVAATGALWERSQAFAVRRITIDLNYLVNFSVQVRVVPLLGTYRVLECLSRVLPIVVTMTVYKLEYALYIVGVDCGLIFLCMAWTLLLQGGHLGKDKLRCTCNSFLSFLARFIFVCPALVFFYLDTLMGRTRDNTYVNPVIYYILRNVVDLSVLAYLWGVLNPWDQSSATLPGREILSADVNPKHSADVIDLVQASLVVNVLSIFTTIYAFRIMRKYYAVDGREAFGVCPCWCYTTPVRKIVMSKVKPNLTTINEYVHSGEGKEDEDGEEEIDSTDELLKETELLDAGADAALMAAMAAIQDTGVEKNEGEEKKGEEEK